MIVVWILLMVLLAIGVSGLWRLFCVGDLLEDDDEEPPRFI